MYRLSIHLQPRAARSRIVGRHGDAIKAQVQAPPVDGAANAALVELIADSFALPRRAVRLAQGQTSRTKVIEIDADPLACEIRLREILGEGSR